MPPKTSSPSTSAHDAPMIRLRRVVKEYPGPVRAVDGVDLDVARGELMVLLGGSGCGKTTTLKMINRLVEPTSGSIEIDAAETRGTDPVRLRRSIGYVFQGVGLFPHMTVGANVGVTLRLLGTARAEISRRVDELLDLVGLPPSDYRDRAPRELSGGQRQRVGVARALAASPRVMLMDEPFGALDPITRDTLQSELRSLHRRLGLTIVLVTHDMTEALLLADRIAVMRDGRIVQVGAPRELLHNPADEGVAALMETPKRQADALEALAAPGAGGANGARR